MSRRDERAIPAGPGEHDVAWFVPSQRVRATRGGVVERSTMLTSSDTLFTTHTSVFVRAATATGSSPTGMESTCVNPALSTLNTSRRSSGVFTAKSRVPSGDSARGRT
jgi:hypothetical protein